MAIKDVIGKPVKAGTNKKVVKTPKKSLAKNLGDAANSQFKAGSKGMVKVGGKILPETAWMKSIKTTKGIVQPSKKELEKMTPKQRKALKEGTVSLARQTGM